jgi:hypothetical protein
MIMMSIITITTTTITTTTIITPLSMAGQRICHHIMMTIFPETFQETPAVSRAFFSRCFTSTTFATALTCNVVQGLVQLLC